MPHLFEPFTQKSLSLRNRLVMAAMCQYSAGTDGIATDWHVVHYGARAVGGVALIISEAIAVEPRGRISEGDLGIWNEAQTAALKPIIEFVHKQGAKFGFQLAHAGRKAWSPKKGHGPEAAVAPSALPYAEDWGRLEALDTAGIDRIVAAFGAAAGRARDLGSDMLEIHGAHGYLVHQFLSPLTNRRTDEYGGSLENRARFLQRIVAAVKAEFPADRPVWVRISATDWVAGGWDVDEAVALGKMMKEWGVDLVDCSSGGNLPQQQITNLGPGYQVMFAERIRREAGIPTGAVGLITEARQAEQIVATGQADLVLVARELLRDPNFPLRAAHELGQETKWPVQYERGKFTAR